MAKKIVRGNLNSKQIVEAEKTVNIDEQAVVDTSSKTNEAPNTNPLESSGTSNRPTSGAPAQPNQGVANPQIAGPTPGQIKGPEVGKPEGQTGITDKDRNNLPNVAERKAEDIENSNQDVRKIKDQQNQPSTPSGNNENGENSNNGVTAPAVNKNTTGSAGLNSDNKVQNAAAQKIQDANKTAQDLKNAKNKLDLIKLAGGAGCWWILLGILIIILVIVIVNFGGVAYNATLGEFGKSAPLPSGQNYENAKKVLQFAGANLKTSGGGSNKYKQLVLTDTDKKAIEDGKIDKRLLDMLVYLSKLHAYLKVSSIVDGYTKTTTLESGADRTDQITANISAHVNGLATDISEIDYVYRVNEPKESCQNAVAALCGPLAFTCKQVAKEMEWGDLVYYASDEVKVPADLIPANIQASAGSVFGQDPTSLAANQATNAANQNVSSILEKIKQSQDKLKQMLDKFNNTKNTLIARRNALTNQLTGTQGAARQTIQSQIDLLNQNISKVDGITAKIGGYQSQIIGYGNITNSLQGNLSGISQTITKYSNLNNLNINVPVDTSSSLVDGKIQGLISQATNKISDVTPLQSVAGTVNSQIGDLSGKINIANTSITQFTSNLDPILNDINSATSQLEGKINSTTSGALNQTDFSAINTIGGSITSIGSNPVLSQAGNNPFDQLQNTASSLTSSIQGQVDSAISSGIGTATNTINAPVNEINGIANTKIDAINQNLSSLVNGLNGLKGNFASQAAADINHQTAEGQVFQKLNDTITKIQSILQTTSTLRNNLGNFVSKVTALQNSLSTIGNVASTVASVNKFTSKIGVDTSSAQNIADQITKINSAISNSLTKVNGILGILDQETANLTALLSQLQNYSNQPASEVSKYIDTLTPTLTTLDSIGHIDILSALNIDLSPLSSLQGIIDGYIEKLKTEAFTKIQAELQAQLTKVVGDNISQVIGSQIPGLSLLGLGGGVDNQELARYSCLGNIKMVTPSNTKLGGNKAVIVPLKVQWQESSGLASVSNIIDKANFTNVLMPETRKKVHELLTQTLQFPYDMKNIFYYKANQIITFNAERDVKPFWKELEKLYGVPRGENIGLFAMPEALPHVHIAY